MDRNTAHEALTTELGQIIDKEEHLYLLGRPVWGPPSFDPRQLTEQEYDMASVADKLLKQGGGIIILLHDEASEKSAYLLMLRLFSRFKTQKRKVQFINNQGSGLVTEEKIQKQSSFIFMPNAPRLADINEFLDRNWHSKVILASGLENEWQELFFDFQMPYFIHVMREPDIRTGHFENELRKIMAEEQTRLRRSDNLLSEAHFLTTVFDALAVPMPFPLMARVLGVTEVELARLLTSASGILYLIEQEKPPALLVTTKGTAVAKSFVDSFWGQNEERILDIYSGVIESSDSRQAMERHTVINLLRALIQRGRSIQARKTIDASEAKINDLLRYPRANAPELLSWGRIFHHLYKFQKARLIFERALNRYPDNLYLMHALAHMLGQWAADSGEEIQREARRRFNEALAIDKKNIPVWHSYANMERRLGNYDEARSLFTRALEEAPENLYLTVSLAALEIEADNLGRAEKLLAWATAREPLHLYANHLSAVLHSKKCEYDSAEKYFLKVTQLDPQNTATFNARAKMYLDRGQWRKAEHLANSAQKIKPDSIPNLHIMGKLRYEQNDLNKAKDIFEIILSIENGNVAALTALSQTELKLGNRERSNQLFEQASKIQPNNPIVYSAWAEAMLDSEPQKALDKLNMALLHGGGVPTRNILAKYWAAQGDLEHSRQIFRNCLKSAVGHEKIETLNTWAEVEARARQFDRALRRVDEALGMDDENSYTLLTKAFVLQSQGNHQESDRLQNKAQEVRNRPLG